MLYEVITIRQGMNVEDIQNQVERSLMAENYFAVAKSYMLYRQKHSEDRDTRDRIKFLIDYCAAGNAATGSKFDANANVDKKNIATLIGELPKGNFIRLNRRLLTDRLSVMYGKELADKYLGYLNQHLIYKNDRITSYNVCYTKLLRLVFRSIRYAPIFLKNSRSSKTCHGWLGLEETNN